MDQCCNGYSSPKEVPEAEVPRRIGATYWTVQAVGIPVVALQVVRVLDERITWFVTVEIELHRRCLSEM